MVPSEEVGFGKRHFVIFYDLVRQAYFIKDLEDGTGTFVKIMPSYKLKNNTTISCGETHFAIIFPPETGPGSGPGPGPGPA